MTNTNGIIELDELNENFKLTDLELMIDNKTKTFKLNQLRFHMTYPSKIDKKELLTFIIKTTRCDVEFYSICHEKYSNSNTNEEYHTHCLIKLKKRICKTKTTIFDYNGKHPNIKKVNNDLHFKNCWIYHTKEDLEPYTNILIKDVSKNEKHNFIEQIIIDSKSWTQCLLNDDIKYDISLKMNFWKSVFDNTRKLPIIKTHITDENLQPYQKEVLKILQAEPKPRSILWIWSEELATEKSSLANYIGNKFNGDYLPIKLDNKNCMGDFVNVYNNEKIVWIDLSRNMSHKINHNLLYDENENMFIRGNEVNKFVDFIEELSDRKIMTSTKYQGKKIAFIGHIVITTNANPEKITNYYDNSRIQSIKATKRNIQ